MAVIQDIIAALWQHDFAALADPHVVSVVYFVMETACSYWQARWLHKVSWTLSPRSLF